MAGEAVMSLVRVWLASELDDVDCSLSTAQDRCDRAAVLAEEVGAEGIAEAEVIFLERLKEVTHYASGIPYIQEVQ